MIFALSSASVTLLFFDAAACFVATIALIAARRERDGLFSSDAWASLRNLLRCRPWTGQAYKRQSADIWLSLATTASVFVSALIVFDLPLIYADATGRLSPADAVLFPRMPVDVYIAGELILCACWILLLSFIYAARCSISPRLKSVPRVAVQVIRSRMWVVLSALLLTVTVALMGKVAFYQLFGDPYASTGVWIDSLASTLKVAPVVDLQIQGGQVQVAVTVTAKQRGAVTISMEHVRDPNTCRLVRNDTAPVTPRMRLSSWTLRDKSLWDTDYAADLALARNDNVTVQCRIDDVVEEPSGAYRRLKLQTDWIRRVRVTPDAGTLQFLQTQMPYRQAIAAASIANLDPAPATLGSLMIDGEDVTWRSVPQPALDFSEAHNMVKMPPLFVIDWRDARAQVIEELFVLLSGAIAALALAMLVEAVRPDLDALQRLD
jgi:hypothetical protein